jgi:hypothetical protein
MPQSGTRADSARAARQPSRPGGPSNVRPPLWRSAWFLVWAADAIVLGMLCTLIALALAAHGRPAIEVAEPVAWFGAYAVLKFVGRLEFRRGWRMGHRAGVSPRTSLTTRGLTAAPLCDAVAGDVVPEPWDRPTGPDAGAVGLSGRRHARNGQSKW